MVSKSKFFIAIIVTIACASSTIQITKSPEEAASVLASQIIPKLQDLSKQKAITIAIVPFGGPKGKPTPFGKKMAAILQLKLLSDKWILLERDQLEKIIQEKNLAISGLTTEKEYMQAGTLAGADYIITGTTYYGKKALVSVKIVNVKTSIVEGIAQVYINFKE